MSLKSTKLKKLITLSTIIIGALAPLGFANSASVPTNGLIGYWAGNGNANDSSSLGNNGTFSGNYVAGASGGKAFDLSTGKVVIPNNPAYSFSSSFSVGFWFNVNGTSTNQIAFLGEDDGGGTTNKWFIDYNYANPGKFEFHMNGPTSVFLPSNTVNVTNGWNQLTVVDNNNNFSFYLNGNNIGNDIFAGMYPHPSNNLIFGQAEGGFNYNGLMNNVVIYNRALTGPEIQNLVTSTPIPAAIWLVGSGLVGLFGFARRKPI